VEYLPGHGYEAYQVAEYLDKEAGNGIRLKDQITHCRALAHLADQIRRPDSNHPPLRTLLNAFLQAQQFIHFTTFGISHVFIGALKAVAQRVRVRGIVSNADAGSLAELTEYGSEAPGLTVHAFGTDSGVREVPHQKLIVIDGLIAFKGSPNLTTFGWRKVEKGLEMVEVVTDVEEVAKLHNQYFSPIWGKCSAVGDAIEMSLGFPF
jgi:phosphatidylserine/phosphatidylglycerophosphate/cardiolipin synthase-like enzyme